MRSKPPQATQITENDCRLSCTRNIVPQCAQDTDSVVELMFHQISPDIALDERMDHESDGVEEAQGFDPTGALDIHGVDRRLGLQPGEAALTFPLP